MTPSAPDQLLQCFRTVFPGNTDAALSAATPETLAAWDSATHFTLLQVVEEQFGLNIPESVAGELLSFDEFKCYVESRA